MKVCSRAGRHRADVGWQTIENLETLTGLEELWLGKNKITEIKVYPFSPRRTSRCRYN